MKRSTLILALVSGLAMPLSAAADTTSQPLPAPGYDVAPIEQTHQQQMSDRGMRLGAEGSAGATMLTAADEPLSQPLPAPGYDVVPLEQTHQQQMSDRTMRIGAEGSAGATMFDRLDKDMDGVINKQEAEKSSTTNRDFGTLDTNQDGLISRDEWKGSGQ